MPQRIHIQIHKSKQQSNIEVSKASTTPPTILNHNLGLKNYELSNHLGNVTTVISDRKIPRSILGTNINFYMPDIVSATDYYPFGMTMQERSFSAGGAGYRYGFNGKENDAESNTQDYGMRIYDTRLGKFLSVDPLTNKFAMLTPYQFASNTPIQAIDLDGEEGINIVDHQAKITTIVLQIIYVPSESKNTENGSGFTDKEVKQIQANLNNYLQQYQGEFMDNRYTDENGDAYEVQFNFYFTPVANTKEASVVIQEQGTFTSYLVYHTLKTVYTNTGTLTIGGESNKNYLRLNNPVDVTTNTHEIFHELVTHSLNAPPLILDELKGEQQEYHQTHGGVFVSQKISEQNINESLQNTPTLEIW